MARSKRDPWELPAFPIGGDESKDITFTGIGRVISEWEAVEFGLSRIHSVFCGDPDGEALRLYGKGRIFKERHSILSAAGDQYFVTKPNQDLEGRLVRLLRATEGFADRRNEVAHGIVMAASNIEYFRIAMKIEPTELRYALMPPYYLLRKHQPDGFPAYAYNAEKLSELHKLLSDLSLQIENFRRSVVALQG